MSHNPFEPDMDNLAILRFIRQACPPGPLDKLSALTSCMGLVIFTWLYWCSVAELDSVGTQGGFLMHPGLAR